MHVRIITSVSLEEEASFSVLSRSITLMTQLHYYKKEGFHHIS